MKYHSNQDASAATECRRDALSNTFSTSGGSADDGSPADAARERSNCHNGTISLHWGSVASLTAAPTASAAVIHLYGESKYGTGSYGGV
jgi:hypothetical protein